MVGVGFKLNWNGQGLGNLRPVTTLKDLVCTHKANLVFLSKTLVHKNKIDEIYRSINFDSCFQLIGKVKVGDWQF